MTKRAKFDCENMANLRSDAEASAALFGVAGKSFTDVASRAGLIERSHGGVLFLDEIHTAPAEIQKRLLRTLEECVIRRTGADKRISVDVQFIFATNAEPPDYGLVDDFRYRLRIVDIPPLSDRRADVPEIFDYLLKKELAKHNISPESVYGSFDVSHYEGLCLHGYTNGDNVRGLYDIAAKTASLIASEYPAERALFDKI